MRADYPGALTNAMLAVLPTPGPDSRGVARMQLPNPTTAPERSVVWLVADPATGTVGAPAGLAAEWLALGAVPFLGAAGAGGGTLGAYALLGSQVSPRGRGVGAAARACAGARSRGRPSRRRTAR